MNAKFIALALGLWLHFGTAHAAGIFINGAQQAVNLATTGLPTALKAVSEASVSVWIKPSDTSTLRQFVTYSNGLTGNKMHNRLVLSILPGGIVSAAMAAKDSDSSTQGVATTAGSVVNGNWYQVVATFHLGTSGTGVAEIYINGLLSASRTGISYSAGTTSNTPSTRAVLGAATNEASLFYLGDLEDIQVYNRALTDADVSSLYATPGSTVGNIVDKYPFNDLPFYTFTSPSVHDTVGAFPGMPNHTIFNELGPVAP